MPDWDRRFLSLAAHVSTWSKDPSTKCGAVIVRGDRTIASLGFNGFARGLYDSPEVLEIRDEKYKRIIHAEMNAILFLREVSTADFTLYTWPLPPCCRCAAHLCQTGIGRVVAPRGAGAVWDRMGVQLTRSLFREAGIELEEIEYEVPGCDRPSLGDAEYSGCGRLAEEGSSG